MSQRSFVAAFVLGLAALAWVATSFIGSSWMALAMTALIAAAYLLGAHELRQFRAATQALRTCLEATSAAPASLAEWLDGVPASLRHAVRLRVEGERSGLPGPALTPYLVGLLVMLGMLGTFLGMVVTFKGAVFALQGSTDLQAIRSALAEPIRGLGLSFGTSVAGVAASAMLGLMSAIARRERFDTARLLDTRIAGVLRPLSFTHQREETFRALQGQARALPDAVALMEKMMERMEQRSVEMDRQLLERQAQFQREVTAAYDALARSVGASLKESVSASAVAAGDAVRPLAESLAGTWRSEMTLLRAEEERRGAAAVQRLGELQDAVTQHLGTLGAALEAPITRMLQTAAEVPKAAADVIAQLRSEMQRVTERENLAVQERTSLLERLAPLVQALERSAGEQGAAIQAMATSATAVLEQAQARFATSLDAQAARAAETSQQAHASADELANLAQAFAGSVQTFHAGNEKLNDTLQRVEASLQRSTARSDEQLAYYVAQAREVIDLSLSSQQTLLESLRALQSRRRSEALADEGSA